MFGRFIASRVLASAVVVLGVSVIAFLMLHIIAPSPGAAALGTGASARAIEAYNKANGYDSPIVVQYWRYLVDLVHGNLGFSYKFNQPVSRLFMENIWRSLYLSGASLILAVVIAVPLGIYQATKRYSFGDYTATAVSFTLVSMPAFFLGIILIEVFALRVHIFPPQGSQSPNVFAVIADPRAMVLPIVTLTAVNVANFARYMRSSAIDTLSQDYIRLAHAKGLPNHQVIRRHLLKNSGLPMITLVGLSVPRLLAGNLLIETLFNYPGLGLLFYNALGTEDYSILVAYTLIGSVLTVIGNFVADVAVAAADPRVRAAG